MRNKRNIKDNTELSQPQKGKRKWILGVLLLVVLIGSGIMAFEFGKTSSQAKQPDKQVASQKNSSSSKKNDRVKKNSTKKSTAAASESVSSSSTSTSSSTTFQLTNQNLSFVGWNNAALYYLAHKLGYSDIIPYIDSGSVDMWYIDNQTNRLVFSYQDDRDDDVASSGVGFEFNDDQTVSFYKGISQSGPFVTVSSEQVKAYCNSVNAGRQVEDLNMNLADLGDSFSSDSEN